MNETFVIRFYMQGFEAREGLRAEFPMFVEGVFATYILGVCQFVI